MGGNMGGTGATVRYAPVLFSGLLVTLELSAASIVAGTVIGLVVAPMRSSRTALWRWPAALYIESFRSVPVLVQLYFMYYGLPLVLGIDLPTYPAAVAALGLYSGAYLAEAFRTGLSAVQIGQWEAALSLGMTRLETLQHIIWPQAIRIAVPPAISVYVFTVKDSSVASVIGYFELTGSGLAIRESTFGASTFEILLVVAALYMLVALGLTAVGHLVERRVAI